jgi:hypothetical protein
MFSWNGVQHLTWDWLQYRPTSSAVRTPANWVKDIVYYILNGFQQFLLKIRWTLFQCKSTQGPSLVYPTTWTGKYPKHKCAIYHFVSFCFHTRGTGEQKLKVNLNVIIDVPRVGQHTQLHTLKVTMIAFWSQGPQSQFWKRKSHSLSLAFLWRPRTNNSMIRACDPCLSD